MIGGHYYGSHLHHIKPPITISEVVSSVIKIVVFLLQVDAALAALLFQVAVGPDHEDEAHKGHTNRNRNQDVVSD